MAIAKPPNSGKPWSKSDILLATGFITGRRRQYKSIEEIAEKLGRSYGAVAQVQCKARWAKRYQEVL